MRIFTATANWTFTLTLALVLTACSGHAPAPPPIDGGLSMASGYPIGITDVLLVKVYGDAEVTVEVSVRPDGMISVPFIDDVRAAGKSSQ